jgi:hypothetical protein
MERMQVKHTQIKEFTEFAGAYLTVQEESPRVTSKTPPMNASRRNRRYKQDAALERFQTKPRTLVENRKPTKK